MKKFLLLSLLVHLSLLPVAAYYLRELPANHSEQPAALEIELTRENSGTLPNHAATAPASLAPSAQPPPATTSIAPTPTPGAVANNHYLPAIPDNSETGSNAPLAAAPLASSATVQTGSPSETIAAATADRNTGPGVQAVPHSLIPPRILRRLDPEYPEQARKRQLQGSVTLEVEILPSGRPNNISIFASSEYPLLDQAAIAAVQQWSFVPAKDGITGEPVACITHIPFIFRTN